MGNSTLDELDPAAGHSPAWSESPHASPAWHGKVVALHLCPRAFLPMRWFEALTLVAGYGIEGDRYATGTGFYSHKPEEGRQVTLFEEETLEALWRDHGVALSPAEHRRNVTTRSVPLNHLVGRRFRLGATLLEATRPSVPCRRGRRRPPSASAAAAAWSLLRLASRSPAP